ncbi:isoprenoid synthase domain-containing protein, partial [Mycena sanguinolenta]
PALNAVFVDAFHQFTRGSLAQTTHRIAGSTPTVEEFIQIRRNSSAMGLNSALVEYAMDLNIPEDIYNHPTMVAVRDAAGDIYVWNNDICSFNNEQSHGDSQNLVYCVFVEKHCSVQEAMDHVADMIRARVNDFMLLKETDMPTSSFPESDVRRYLKALEYWISGSLRWYYHSARGHYVLYPF